MILIIMLCESSMAMLSLDINPKVENGQQYLLTILAGRD